MAGYEDLPDDKIFDIACQLSSFEDVEAYGLTHQLASIEENRWAIYKAIIARTPNEQRAKLFYKYAASLMIALDKQKFTDRIGDEYQYSSILVQKLCALIKFVNGLDERILENVSSQVQELQDQDDGGQEQNQLSAKTKLITKFTKDIESIATASKSNLADHIAILTLIYPNDLLAQPQYKPVQDLLKAIVGSNKSPVLSPLRVEYAPWIKAEPIQDDSENVNPDDRVVAYSTELAETSNNEEVQGDENINVLFNEEKRRQMLINLAEAFRGTELFELPLAIFEAEMTHAWDISQTHTLEDYRDYESRRMGIYPIYAEYSRSLETLEKCFDTASNFKSTNKYSIYRCFARNQDPIASSIHNKILGYEKSQIPSSSSIASTLLEELLSNPKIEQSIFNDLMRLITMAPLDIPEDERDYLLRQSFTGITGLGINDQGVIAFTEQGITDEVTLGGSKVKVRVNAKECTVPESVKQFVLRDMLIDKKLYEYFDTVTQVKLMTLAVKHPCATESDKKTIDNYIGQLVENYQRSLGCAALLVSENTLNTLQAIAEYPRKITADRKIICEVAIRISLSAPVHFTKKLGPLAGQWGFESYVSKVWKGVFGNNDFEPGSFLSSPWLLDLPDIDKHLTPYAMGVRWSEDTRMELLAAIYKSPKISADDRNHLMSIFIKVAKNEIERHPRPREKSDFLFGYAPMLQIIGEFSADMPEVRALANEVSPYMRRDESEGRVIKDMHGIGNAIIRNPNLNAEQLKDYLKQFAEYVEYENTIVQRKERIPPVVEAAMLSDLSQRADSSQVNLLLNIPKRLCEIINNIIMNGVGPENDGLDRKVNSVIPICNNRLIDDDTVEKVFQFIDHDVVREFFRPTEGNSKRSYLGQRHAAQVLVALACNQSISDVKFTKCIETIKKLEQRHQSWAFSEITQSSISTKRKQQIPGVIISDEAEEHVDIGNFERALHEGKPLDLEGQFAYFEKGNAQGQSWLYSLLVEGKPDEAQILTEAILDSDISINQKRQLLLIAPTNSRSEIINEIEQGNFELASAWVENVAKIALSRSVNPVEDHTAALSDIEEKFNELTAKRERESNEIRNEVQKAKVLSMAIVSLSIFGKNLFQDMKGKGKKKASDQSISLLPAVSVDDSRQDFLAAFIDQEVKNAIKQDQLVNDTRRIIYNEFSKIYLALKIAGSATPDIRDLTRPGYLPEGCKWVYKGAGRGENLNRYEILIHTTDLGDTVFFMLKRRQLSADLLQQIKRQKDYYNSKGTYSPTVLKSGQDVPKDDPELDRRGTMANFTSSIRRLVDGRTKGGRGA